MAELWPPLTATASAFPVSVPPLVSIIVPSYNRADLIRRCYDSVVAQGHRPLEFLLADDASTDDTAAVTAALPPAEGVMVRYLRQPTNRGVSAARNMAVRAAQGEVIAFLDSDDVWFPCHLEKVLGVLEKSGADVVYARGEIRESPDAPPSGRSDFGPQPREAAETRECLYYYNFVLPSVTVVRRGFFERVGYFDEDPQIQHAEDWDIFARAARVGLKFEHLPEATAYYIVPAQVPKPKQLMMLRRVVYCLEKHHDYPFTSVSRRRLSLGYFRVFLGMQLGAETAEAQSLFHRVWSVAWWHPLMGASSLCGLLLPKLPSGLRSFFTRLQEHIFRRLRARHRALRGFADPWG